MIRCQGEFTLVLAVKKPRRAKVRRRFFIILPFQDRGSGYASAGQNVSYGIPNAPLWEDTRPKFTCTRDSLERLFKHQVRPGTPIDATTGLTALSSLQVSLLAPK